MAGARIERQLVNTYTSLGWGALRVPTSGSATDRDLPDVLTGRTLPDPDYSYGVDAASEAYAIEVKSTQGTTAYAGRDELKSLDRFASAFGAQPLVAAYFKQQGGERSRYYLVPPEELRMTDNNAGVPEATATDRARFIVYPSTDTQQAALDADVTDDVREFPDPSNADGIESRGGQ
jgi:Holliday junction resolvase